MLSFVTDLVKETREAQTGDRLAHKNLGLFLMSWDNKY